MVCQKCWDINIEFHKITDNSGSVGNINFKPMTTINNVRALMLMTNSKTARFSHFSLYVITAEWTLKGRFSVKNVSIGRFPLTPSSTHYRSLTWTNRNSPTNRIFDIVWMFTTPLHVYFHDVNKSKSIQ